MDESGTIRATRSLTAAGAFIAGCAIAAFVFRSLAGPRRGKGGGGSAGYGCMPVLEIHVKSR